MWLWALFQVGVQGILSLVMKRFYPDPLWGILGPDQKGRHRALAVRPTEQMVVGYIEMPDNPPLVINNEKGIKDIELDSWNNEKVHRWKYIPIIPQKCHPGLLLFLVWMFCLILSQIPRNSGFRDIIKPKNQQFGIDSWCSPAIFSNHSINEISDFFFGFSFYRAFCSCLI